MRYRQLGGLEVSEFCLGTIPFGTGTDEETAFALLDRFHEAGGTLIDTANNYDQWATSGAGGESEVVIGRWIRSRGLRDQVVVATKVGAHSVKVSGDPAMANWEGLGAKAIRRGVQGSLERLGVDHIDLYYAHWDDREPELAETVGEFGALATEGLVRAIGCSNMPVWRIERARSLARAAGIPGFSCVQQLHTYLWPRPDRAQQSVVTGELLDYARSEPDFTVLGYKPLLHGGYTRHDRRPFELGYEHPSNEARLRVLQTVAEELGATPNQVVLAWIMQSDPAIIPVSAAGSLAQLDEQLAAADLELDDAVLDRLTTAGAED
jgi:aryl-alcohol dehydrogenase-like predicted oxidoreductase